MHHEAKYNIYYCVQHLRLTYNLNFKLNRDIKGQNSFYCVFSVITILCSPPVFSEVRVIRPLVLYISFVDRCLSSCTFSSGHGLVYSSSIYGFWLLLWYLQTLLNLSPGTSKQM